MGPFHREPFGRGYQCRQPSLALAEAERKGFRALHAEAVVASHTWFSSSAPSMRRTTTSTPRDGLACVASSSDEVTRPRIVLEGQRARVSR